MITKINEGLYLGDSSANLELQEPTVTVDLSGWDFDLEPMEGAVQHIEISKIVGTIKRIRDSDIPVLVKCHGGMDRSPFIVACYLWGYKYDYDVRNYLEAYDEVKRLHPATVVHDDWMRWYVKDYNLP